MSSDDVEKVREFNRTVTQRIGVLSDQYLGRARALGAARVLWEIGPGGTDVRTIRARLDLDSGYLSRILRGLESEGLVTVEPDPGDQRARVIHLTRIGRIEQAVLDRESDQLAESLLAPLDGERRQRLLDAMATVERLLTAGLVDVRVEDPDTRAARFCIESYFAELEVRFPHGFDRSITISADGDEIREPNGLFLVARLRGEPVGCGALKFHGTEPTELKRMWVANATRGLGIGRRLLTELEDQARRRGVSILHLETNSSLVEAISLYLSTGYVEVPRFNDEPHSDHWFEKHL
jgi:DNA-binding MarR family transcriptional regulator/N-acetylglutamate synthase-like GNAT family acetyltransferase